MQKLVIVYFLLILVSFTSYGQYYEGPYDPVKIHYKTPGFISVSEVSYGDGLGESGRPYSDYFVSITSVLGYYVSQNFMFGAGIGVYFYNGGSLIPIYADARFTFNFKKINPYIFADAGFLIDPEDPGSTTKLFMNPGLGVRFVLNYSLAAVAGVGGFVQEGGVSEGDRDTFINYKLGLVIKPRRK